MSKKFDYLPLNNSLDEIWEFLSNGASTIATETLKPKNIFTKKSFPIKEIHI